MDGVTFQRRLRAILGDPVLGLPVLDERTEEPYLQLCELFMECDERQRQHVRNGWPYGREWRIPVPGTTADWPGGKMTARRVRGHMVANALLRSVADFRDIVIGFPIVYWSAQALGMDADALFLEVANAAIPEVRDLITSWISESDRQTPEQMGWMLVDTPGGPRYKISG
jgi:hypothetical protein